jgi:ABC-type transport system substrate-binding protein
MSNRLRHLNPLGVGNYWDSVIWSRLYESLLGLNPFLLMKGVAEDSVNLADSFYTEIVNQGRIRQRLHFRIRPDILWHDGEPFTVQDVAFTFLSMLGGRGRLIAQQHASTSDLVPALTNNVAIPAWSDLAAWLHHIEIRGEREIDLFLTENSRYIHEWFGDMPIVPMHIWQHLGDDFTKPQYQGVEGLYAIVDNSRKSPNAEFCGWHGLVGTGPFMWEHGKRDPLNEGGSLRVFESYHHRAV